MPKEIKSWLADKPEDHLEKQLERAKRLQKKLEGHIEKGELDAEMLADATCSGRA